MSYTKKDVLREIHDEYLQYVMPHTRGTVVKSTLCAPMIPQEAGRDRHTGKINPLAVRFEPGVFRNLSAIRDRGYYATRKGRFTSYNGIRQAHVAGISEAALRNLSSSWGITQCMGYYVLNFFKDADGTPVTIAELRSNEKHFHYVIQLLCNTKDATADILGFNTALERHKADRLEYYFERILRRWNAGSPIAPTYDPNYVKNGLSYLHLWLDMYGDESALETPNVERMATRVGDDPIDLVDPIGRGNEPHLGRTDEDEKIEQDGFFVESDNEKEALGSPTIDSEEPGVYQPSPEPEKSTDGAPVQQQQGPSVDVGRADTVIAAPVTPTDAIPGAGPKDAVVNVTKSWSARLGGMFGVGTIISMGQWFKENPIVLAIVCVSIAAIVITYLWRTKHLDAMRLDIFASNTKQNAQ